MQLKVVKWIFSCRIIWWSLTWMGSSSFETWGAVLIYHSFSFFGFSN